MDLKKLHKATDKKLLAVAQKAINHGNMKEISKNLGEKHGVSGQTIRNYVFGQGKDGFLKQCLIEDFENL